MTNSTGKAALVFLSIFVAGGVTGHFVSLRIACARDAKKTEQPTQVQNQPRRPIEEWSHRFKKDFNARVGVTPEQLEQIEPVVVTAQAEFRRLRDQFGQHAADVTERLDAEVMKLLNDEQKPKYEQMIKERQERFRKKEAERAAAAAAAAAKGEPQSGPPHRGDRPPPPPQQPTDKASPGTPTTQPVPAAQPAPASGDTVPAPKAP